MKFNLGKLLNILGQLVVAIPTIAEAVKPIVHEVKGTKAPPMIGPEPTSSDHTATTALPSQ
jgi:hypothetical protein